MGGKLGMKHACFPRVLEVDLHAVPGEPTPITSPPNCHAHFAAPLASGKNIVLRKPCPAIQQQKLPSTPRSGALTFLGTACAPAVA